MENKDYIQQSLADKDINSSIKDGKVVVHKDNKNAAKAHLKKIGHGHVQVVSELNVSFIDYLKETIIEEVNTGGFYTRHSDGAVGRVHKVNDDLVTIKYNKGPEEEHDIDDFKKSHKKFNEKIE